MTDSKPLRFPAGIGALGHRDFRLFWSGHLISVIGTWMQSVAQAWLVLELTDSPFRLGLIGTLQFSPMLLLAFVAGVLTDRLPKRRLVIATQSVLLLQSLGLAVLVWSGRVEYWHVGALAVLYGVANTLDMPARQAFIVELVGREDLMNAIVLNSAAFNGARVVGPAVAGLLIARWGLGPAFFLNALSFLAVIGALLVVRAEGRPRPRTSRSLRAEIREGVGYALRTPRITLALSLVLVVSAFLLNYNVLVPLLARVVLHQAAEGFGVLMAAVGGGALCGAAAMALFGRGRPPTSALVGPALVLGAATVAMAGVRRFWVAAALLLVMGCSGILVMAGANTTLQLTVPDELRGRLMSLHMLVFVGVMPFGSFLLGSLVETLGPAMGFAMAGTGGLVSVLAITAWWARRKTANIVYNPDVAQSAK